MQVVEELQVVRCQICDGLYGVAARHVTRSTLCPDCRRGDVRYRSHYYGFWLERFTREEIKEMSKAIWG